MKFLPISFPSLAGLLGLAGCLLGCETTDIEPVLTLTAEGISENRISENGAAARIVATLNGPSKKDVVLRFTLAGTALSGVDYTLSALEIRIPAGKIRDSLMLTTRNNDREEGNKTLVLQLASVSQAQVRNLPFTLTLTDDDKDSDGDGLVDAVDDCPDVAGIAANRGCPAGFGLLFNEVLYDPALGPAGDANGDGLQDKFQDGFVEIFNNRPVEQDLSGYVLADLDIAGNIETVRFTFPPATKIPSQKVLVVFGGGTPTGTFGGSPVLVVGTPFGLSMQNSGEKVLLKDPAGNVVLTFDSDALSNNPDESYTRNPDILGDFVQHASLEGGKRFSPGTRTDGSSF